ncbi:MAG TPA: hypothetical protein VHY79_12645 [Rhizomicrobium sp.]|nr:hypothetical protein [Rhizomicrobium sp.]
MVAAINIAGDVAGTCSIRHLGSWGFIRVAHGKGIGFEDGTYPYSINDSGEAAGITADGKSFIYASGAVTTYSIKGAIATAGWSINRSGKIAGYYNDNADVSHGFVREADGTISKFNDSLAGNGNYQGTLARAISNQGEITGYYVDPGGEAHGFIRTRKNKYTTIDPTGSQGTLAVSISGVGAVTGEYYSGGASHGFVRSAEGTITSFDAPDGGEIVYVLSINNDESVVGEYLDVGGIRHGFLRSADGTFTPIDAPGAGTAPQQGTVATSINDDGEIAGYFVDSRGTYVGFLRFPR